MVAALERRMGEPFIHRAKLLVWRELWRSDCCWNIGYGDGQWERQASKMI